MPLTKFCCSICGKCAPKKYLQHSKLGERMDWLRKHYKQKHPRAFAGWYGKSKAKKQTKTRKSLNKRKKRIRR